MVLWRVIFYCRHNIIHSRSIHQGQGKAPPPGFGKIGVWLQTTHGYPVGNRPSPLKSSLLQYTIQRVCGQHFTSFASQLRSVIINHIYIYSRLHRFFRTTIALIRHMQQHHRSWMFSLFNFFIKVDMEVDFFFN